jgi:hypothetical protein
VKSNREARVSIFSGFSAKLSREHFSTNATIGRENQKKTLHTPHQQRQARVWSAKKRKGA